MNRMAIHSLRARARAGGALLRKSGTIATRSTDARVPAARTGSAISFSLFQLNALADGLSGRAKGFAGFTLCPVRPPSPHHPPRRARPLRKPRTASTGAGVGPCPSCVRSNRATHQTAPPPRARCTAGLYGLGVPA